MPGIASLNDSDLPVAASALYTGVRDTPEILALLADYGYTTADADAGLDLVESAEDEAAEQTAEYAEQYAATAAAHTAVATLEAGFVRLRRLARIKYPRGSDAYRALGLAGRLSTRAPGILAAAGTFYRAADANPKLLDDIRGIDKADIDDGLARLDAARTALDTQSRETGEAQQATAEAIAARVRLRAHASEMARTATVALDGRPQLRESLGLLERGS